MGRNCIRRLGDVFKFLLAKLLSGKVCLRREGVRRWRALAVAVIAFGAVLAPAVFSDGAYAAYRYVYGRDSALDKIVAYNLRRCQLWFNDEVKMEDALESSSGRLGIDNTIFVKRDGNGNTIDNSVTHVLMPNTVMTSSVVSDSPWLTCSTFLFGSSEWEGLIREVEWPGREGSLGDGIDAMDRMLWVFGYNRITELPNDETVVDISAYMKVSSHGTNLKLVTSNKVRLDVRRDNSGGVQVFGMRNTDCEVDEALPCISYYYGDGTEPTGGYYEDEFADKKWGLRFGVEDDNEIAFYGTNKDRDRAMPEVKCGSGDLVECDLDSLRDTLLNNADAKNNAMKDQDPSWNITLTIPSPDFGSHAWPLSGNSIYNKGSLGEFIDRLNDYIGADLSSSAEDQFTLAEIYNLYSRYLANDDSVGVSCSSEYELDDVSGWKSVMLKRQGEMTKCYVYQKKFELYSGTDINDANYSYQGHVRYAITKGNISFDELVADMNEMYDNMGIRADELAEFGTGSTYDPSNPGGNVPGGKDDVGSCYHYAASLGWIVCPVLDLMASTSEWMYGEFIEPALKVDARLFASDDGGTRQAWGTFQGIANVLFVIFLLVVIFSQLTGVGIDNYGIKRILPKLIVAAVLVNLSYWICMVCIDLSNILGGGLKSLFDGLSVGKEIIIDGNSLGEYVGGTFLSLAIVGLIVGGTAALISNPAILLTFAVSLLGVLVGLFFLFVLLSARQAALVVMVVISPLAFVCYMLPNTKNLFSKYMKLFEGLLLVYPIAGLLVGGGNYVSRLLLTSGFAGTGMFAAVTAMIVGIVPVFFIPTVLKGSFAALGGIGMKLSGVGKKLGGGLTKKTQGSGWYQNAQESGALRGSRIRAGLKKNGEDSKFWGRTMRVIGGGKRKMAQARSQYLKNLDTRKREDSLMGVGFAAARIGQEKKAESDEVANYMTLINSKTRNGEDEDTLYREFERYMSMGEKGKAGAVAVARIAGRRKDTAARFLRDKVAQPDDREGAARYDRGALAAVMKEVATGENSGMYRQSSPFGFEYAAIFNKNYDPSDTAAATVPYVTWRSNPNNVHDALKKYVTNGNDLVGIQGRTLEEIASLMGSPGGMAAEDRDRIQNLADSVIENRGKPGAVWDSTKAEQLARLSTKYAFVDGKIVDRASVPAGRPVATDSPADMSVPHGPEDDSAYSRDTSTWE